MTATFHVGDAIEVMNRLPEKSVDLILTSPPFLALRSYLPADHEDKALEIGSEPTPGEYVDRLLDVVEACARVLAPHGSLCVELGDTYSGSGGAGGDYAEDGLRDGQPHFRQIPGKGWPLAKSLSLIPESFRWAMVYGHNPFTGRTTEPWRLRNVVRWVRPNPPVGALGDKFRPATSELMVFCKAKDRYFDLDAVREPHKAPEREAYGFRVTQGLAANPSRGDYQQNVGQPMGGSNPNGAPPLDWWNIPLLEGKDNDGNADQGGHDPDAGNPTGLLHGSGRSKGEEQHPLDNTDPARRRDGYLGAGTDGLSWNIPLLEGEEETRYGPKPEAKATNAGPLRARGAQPVGMNSDAGREWAPGERMAINPIGAPPLDWWEIPPGGYPGAHYAVFPPELCVKPVKAMCPEKVCRTCGEPSRRIVESETHIYDGPPNNRRLRGIKEMGFPHSGVSTVGLTDSSGMNPGGQERRRVVTSETWTDCGHDDWRPGMVCDPFGGSGTTAAVATGHGRDCILIDLDERNYDLALDRVGPFILQLGEL